MPDKNHFENFPLPGEIDENADLKAIEDQKQKPQQ